MSSRAYWLRVVPLLPIAMLAVAVAAQSGCSLEGTRYKTGGDDNAATGDDVGCKTSEVPRAVNGKSVCCAESDVDAVVCLDRSAPQADEPCSDEGATKPAGDRITITLDSCVSEDCSGDAISADYAAETSLEQSLLVCVERAGVKTWKVDGDVREQLVTRVCNDAQSSACGGSYGYSGRAATAREVRVLASTCRGGAGVAVDCPVGSL